MFYCATYKLIQLIHDQLFPSHRSKNDTINHRNNTVTIN